MVGTQVKAVRQITEGGERPGDPNAKYPHLAYIHAEAGDVGTVEYVNPDGYPTVRFDRTGTATIVFPVEIEPFKENE